MNDDFNTPILIAHLFDAVKHINSVNNGIKTMNDSQIESLKQTMKGFLFDVLGLEKTAKASSASDDKLNKTISLLLEVRDQARLDKNFALSDQIRDQLQGIGVQLKDTKEGTQFQLD